MKFYTKTRLAAEATNKSFSDNFSAWRWCIKIDWRHIWIDCEAQSKTSGEWRHGYGYYSAHFKLDPRKWGFRREHAYYDGPHDCVVIGPLWIAWQGDWCDKCYEG